MVRIHVVRASHLLAAFAAIVLIALLIIFLLTGAFRDDRKTTDNAHYALWEAEAAFVSASAIFSPEERGESAPEKEEKPVSILIYHTHTHEAYQKKATDEYVETAAWRTKDNLHNIVRVGEELAEQLRKKGFTVIHDTTDHELTDLSTAYTRSLATMEKYVGEIDVYIDLHRDAYNKNGSGNPFSVVTENQSLARLMFLVGNGKGFSDEMHYLQNYELATLLTGKINSLVPGLCRPVMVKDGRYNQHLCERSLLIEVGHNNNDIEEALASVSYLADALESVLKNL